MYNVKQAVSGVQSNLDQGVRNRQIAQALGGLAGGVQTAANLQIGRNQLDRVTKGLDSQSGYFQELADDPNASRIEKMIANENLLKLGMMKAGLTPLNIGDFGSMYKNMFSGKSMFEPVAGIERAKLISEGLAQRQTSQDRWAGSRDAREERKLGMEEEAKLRHLQLIESEMSKKQGGLGGLFNLTSPFSEQEMFGDFSY